MNGSKEFDCVWMKNEIQARLREQWEGLTEAQIRAKVQNHLATSDSELAKWWRSTQAAKQQPAGG